MVREDRRPHGFSLLELMVVLAIAGAVLGFGYPRLALLTAHYRLEGAARNLALTLQKTRLRAIGEGQCFQVSFDSAGRSFQVAKKVGASPCGASGFTNEGSTQAIDAAGRIAVSATANPVFGPRGGADATSVVTLTSPTESVRLVAVNAAGRVDVQ